jgi:hypothetical protein
MDLYASYAEYIRTRLGLAAALETDLIFDQTQYVRAHTNGGGDRLLMPPIQERPFHMFPFGRSTHIFLYYNNRCSDLRRSRRRTGLLTLDQ